MPPSVSALLVGRSSEQAKLRGALTSLAGGAVSVELVGDPGMGKTTMMTWLRELAVHENALVLDGRGSEFEHDVPFGLFVDALDEHLRDAQHRWSRSLGAEVVAELTGIFPALRASREVALDGGFTLNPTTEQLGELAAERVFISGRQQPCSKRTQRRMQHYRTGAQRRISHLNAATAWIAAG